MHATAYRRESSGYDCDRDGRHRVTDRGLVLEEVAPGLTAEDVQNATEASLVVTEDLKVMESGPGSASLPAETTLLRLGPERRCQ